LTRRRFDFLAFGLPKFTQFPSFDFFPGSTHDPSMKKLLSSFQFADETFMSAVEKESVLQAWVRFLKNGCAWHDFTIELYQHLTLHCAFIAHYNRLGFYEYYFANPGEQTFRFLDQFDPAKPGVSAEIGMMYWLNGPTASDLNRAMRETTAPYIARIRDRFQLEIKQRHLSHAAALARVYGFSLTEGSGAAIPAPAQCAADNSMTEHSETQPTLFPE
jgi:hypothetical protein